MGFRMHFYRRLKGSPTGSFMHGRPEGVSVSELKTRLKARRGGDQARGFSMIEMLVVIAISMVIAAIAIIQARPALMPIKRRMKFKAHCVRRAKRPFRIGAMCRWSS